MKCQALVGRLNTNNGISLSSCIRTRYKSDIVLIERLTKTVDVAQQSLQGF